MKAMIAMRIDHGRKESGFIWTGELSAGGCCPYTYPRTLNPFDGGYGLTVVSAGKCMKPLGMMVTIGQHPGGFLLYWIFLPMADTAATTSDKTTRPLCAHDPKQIYARMDEAERQLQVNGRIWWPLENTDSTEVEVAMQCILDLPGTLK